MKLSVHARDFLLVTQNVDDLHTRAEWEGKRLPKERIVQIHGDIFVTGCSGCEFFEREHASPPALAISDAPGAGKLDCLNQSSLPEAKDPNLPECPECGAFMRPGVVWFGEQLDPAKIEIVENFLGGGSCDIVFVIGTTALFGYIIDWALRARARNGELIEVNPEETPLSQFATRVVRQPAAVALPRIVNQIIRSP